jgi:O-glycosyl hydrolase
MKMNKRTLLLTGLISIMLIFTLVISCDGDLGNEEKPEEKPGGTTTPTAAETPVISDLASRNYAKNATAEPLTINATTSSGTLSYKWYKNATQSATGSTEIADAITNTYTPPTAEDGDIYYYVVVTNTDETKDTKTASKTSNIARIRVTTVVTGTPDATITVNTETKYQYIRGFGGMMNGWNNSPPVYAKDVDTAFTQEGLGFNIFRVMIYPYMEDLFNGKEEGPPADPTIHQSYYNIIRRAKRYGALILASPWTPPGEWKSNGSRLTGKLKPEHYGDYARHLKNYIELMEKNNAAIDYISTQNEPDIAVSYDGCEWTGEEMRDFMIDFGRYIAPVNGKVKIMPGESYQFRDAYYNPIYNNPESMAALDLIGGHVYGGGLRRHNTPINAGKEVWMTEHLFNTSSNYWIDSQWQSVWTNLDEYHDLMVNDFNAIVWWYIKRFYNLIGDGDYGTIDGRPLFRGYALSHYAKYATGKTRVAATASSSSVRCTAYESDNEITLVFYNKSNNDVGQLDIKIPVAAKGASMVITQSLTINPDGTTSVNQTQADTTAEGVKAMAPEIIVLSADGKTGTLTLPASCIVSVRFTK